MMRIGMADSLRSVGYHVFQTAGGSEAVRLIRRRPFDIVFLDLHMSGSNGIEILKEIKRYGGEVTVAMLTGFGTVQEAVEAMKCGADEFLLKPITFSAVTAVIRKVEDRKRRGENRAGPDLRRHSDDESQLVAHAPLMRKTIDLIDRIAPLPSTVLIEGESGTGKELVARRIHRRSLQSRGPFIAFNCAVMPDQLLESELFGYEKGAFTGAGSRKVGYFEAAQGGTIFIDEISEMSVDLQAKLLRVIQERSFRRVGGIEEIETDARIVTATNRELQGEVAAGRFRKDLYYRINVLKVTVPPLRRRPEDIPLLSEYFIDRFSRRLGTTVSGLGPPALERLMSHQWDGNVRELQNIIERAVVMAAGNEITLQDLPEELRSPDRGETDCSETIDQTMKPYQAAKFEFESEYLTRALQKSEGNVALASRLTGISRQHFYDKLARHGLEQTEFRQPGRGIA
jgi:DNA-binding NtrC family response regulator